MTRRGAVTTSSSEYKSKDFDIVCERLKRNTG
jgi:hypothetical protein